MMKQGNIWKCTRVLMVFFFFQLCMSHQLYYDDSSLILSVLSLRVHFVRTEMEVLEVQ